MKLDGSTIQDTLLGAVQGTVQDVATGLVSSAVSQAVGAVPGIGLAGASLARALTVERRTIAIAGVRLHVFVAGREYTRLPEAWIDAGRHAPLSRAGLTLPDPQGAEISRLAAGDAVEIRYGYRDEPPASWQGTVAWVRHGTKDQTVVGCVGAEKGLVATRITQTFMNESPEAILGAVLGRTGLTVGQLDTSGVTLARVVVSNKNCFELAEQLERSCERQHGQAMAGRSLWVDSQGAVRWGDHAEDQAAIPVIASRQNLLSHEPATDALGLGKVTAFLVPGLWHSTRARVRDERRGLNDLVRVQRVLHRITSASARTEFWYGPETSRS